MLAVSAGLGFRRHHKATAAIALAVLARGHRPRRKKQLRRSPTPAAATASDTNADDFALQATLKTRLAYVLTGDGEIDRTSEDGLMGLSKVIGARTALEPGAPMGVDIENDDLSFFPVLYWPVREDAEPAVR